MRFKTSYYLDIPLALLTLSVMTIFLLLQWIVKGYTTLEIVNFIGCGIMFELLQLEK